MMYVPVITRSTELFLRPSLVYIRDPLCVGPKKHISFKSVSTNARAIARVSTDYSTQNLDLTNTTLIQIFQLLDI